MRSRSRSPRRWPLTRCRPPPAQALVPGWCGVCMPPVEPPQALAGNPGASRCVRAHRHQRRQRRRHLAGDNADANAASARRGPAGRARSTGIGLRSGAEQRRVPGASTSGHSSGCHGRSGCTARPGHGNAHTGTGGREDPCAPRRTEGAGRTRPKRATLLWHRLHRHGVGRGTVVKLPGESDRCRAHLLRHRSRCTAACPQRRRATPTA